ncbi:MAG: tail fiber domain-containing protein [Chitinophagales bacterium]
MNRLLTILFVSSVFCTTGVYAQNVGVGTSSPDNSAKLDVSATDGGLLIPRMTEVQRDAISSPATGLMIFQTDGTVGFYFYDGTAWTALSGSGPAGPQGPAGADGADGAQGPAGPAGADGADGATGPAGPQGPAGVAGPVGPAGANGADGADGAQGPAGPAGPAGADGADGDTWWTEASGNIYRASGYVGFWTTTPSYHLDARGSNNDDGATLSLSNADYSRWLRVFPGKSSDVDPLVMFADNGALRFADDQNGYTEIARMFTGLNGDPTIEMGNGTSAWGRIGSVNGLALWGNGDADVSNNPHVLLHSSFLDVRVDAIFSGGFVNMGPATTTLVDGAIGFYDLVDFQSSLIGLNDNQLRLRGPFDGNHYIAYHGDPGFDGAKIRGNQTISLQTGNMEVVLRDGRMGVGTASPSNGRLHVSGNTPYGSGGGNYFDQGFGNGQGTADYGPFTFNVSIYSENDLVVSGKIAAESDARIKDIQGISNASSDLNTLMDIEITDYMLKDKVRFGDQQFKKVIAQQIEEVFPQAVNTMTNFIPNVYATAMVEKGMVSLEGDIEVGDKLKVFTKEGEERVLEVQAMEGTSYVLEGEFTGEVFVYGKQVDDFLGVDYDALSMLNISATQALYQRLVELEEANGQFQVQVDDVKAELNEIKASLGLQDNKTATTK